MPNSNPFLPIGELQKIAKADSSKIRMIVNFPKTGCKNASFLDAYFGMVVFDEQPGSFVTVEKLELHDAIGMFID